jgi:pimeloyl-ACP methyl ester carboxylesterase
VLLAGGPGDGGSWYFTARRHLADYSAARRTHDLLVVDGRGTGRSRPLGCTGAAACGQALGAARGFYTTADVAADLDAVRAKLGLRRWSLYGISYGTYEAQAYARAYPSRVARLLLDSTVDPVITADPFHLGRVRAVRPALRATCGRRACRGFTRDPWADYVTLVDRLERSSLEGIRVDPRGRPATARLGLAEVSVALAAADINADLRAELPGAVRAALRGDVAPLLRLAEVASLPLPARPDVHSPGRFLATACQEQGLPWSPSTPPEERVAEAGRLVELLPEDAFVPLPRSFGLVDATLMLDCADWPPTSGTAPVGGELPRVPALLLHGDADVRTPLSGARRVARSLPGARLVVFRGAAHNVLRESGSSCPERLIGQFLADRRLQPCRRTASFRVVPPPPRQAGRAAAVRLTVADALRQARMRRDQVRGLRARVRFGGLRGGWADATPRGIRLRAYEYIRGVAVTGRFAARR